MKIELHRTAVIAAFATIAAASASAQAVLFDFNNAPLHTPLPIDLTVAGISAHFSATGQGYSIQDTSAPVVPLGFTGRFIYPSSIQPADLLISFDRTLTDFSILYSPQELGCDDSATMRVTAYMHGIFVGTHTHTAIHPGTWPVDTLSCTFTQGFNSVVVHYDGHPPTCSDYGVIFLADDMRVTPLANVGGPFCFGDGTGHACPCANSGAAGRGCQNSASTGGAQLSGTGVANVSADSVALTSSGELPTALSIVLQGDTEIAPVPFGDGLRCVGGTLKRLYTKHASGGIVTAPGAGDPSISAQSALHGDPIPVGATRIYQTYYRDANLGFCPFGFNASNAIAIAWGA